MKSTSANADSSKRDARTQEAVAFLVRHSIESGAVLVLASAALAVVTRLEWPGFIAHGGFAPFEALAILLLIAGMSLLGAAGYAWLRGGLSPRYSPLRIVAGSAHVAALSMFLFVTGYYANAALVVHGGMNAFSVAIAAIYQPDPQAPSTPCDTGERILEARSHATVLDVLLTKTLTSSLYHSGCMSDAEYLTQVARLRDEASFLEPVMASLPLLKDVRANAFSKISVTARDWCISRTISSGVAPLAAEESCVDKDDVAMLLTPPSA